MGLKGIRFAIMEDIKWKATAELRNTPEEAVRLSALRIFLSNSAE
jgi:hypothetical protein